MLLGPPFPTSVEALTAETLTEAVGAAVTGFTPTRIGADRGMLGDVYLVDLSYADGKGGPSPVVAKFAAGREETLATARRAGTHERELRCYDELLASTPVRAPGLHAAWYDPETAHFLLVQDAVEADESIDQVRGLDRRRAALVVTEAAKLHVRWWGDTSLAERAWLPPLDAEGRRTNLRALITNGWEPLCRMLDGELTEDEEALGIELPDRVDAMLCDLARLPATLIHGDLRTDNLLFAPGGTAVSLVDWQGVGVGPAGFDLAYFVTQCLSVEDRRAGEAELLDRYRRELAAAGVEVDDPLAGYGPANLFGLAVASALPLIGDPGQPRVRRLASTVTRRSIEALRDHDLLWT